MTELVAGRDFVDRWQATLPDEVHPAAPAARYALLRIMRSAGSAYPTRTRHAHFATLAAAQAAIPEAVAAVPVAFREWVSFEAASRFAY